MFKPVRILPTLLLAFCLQPIISFGQGTVFSGSVINESGSPLQNAQVVLNGGEHYDITNSNGDFAINRLKPGQYRLTVSMIGYHTYQKNITISGDGLTHFIITLSEKNYQLENLVVTATRTRKAMENVPMPITVIQHNEIENSGSMRLSDILAEQTGLQLVEDRGTGLQVQGFGPEYTLIMINGQPIIGRRKGTLDLDRISVGNVQRIEIIKGPSSALWGSSALAGVVNIITETAQQPFSVELNSRYGTHQTFDLGARVSWQLQPQWNNTFFINHYSSNGYSLVPNTISKTVPAHQNLTLSYRTGFSISDDIQANLFGRYFTGEQNIEDFIGEVQSPTLLNVTETSRNFGINPSLTFDVTEQLRLEANYFLSGYYNEREIRLEENNSLYGNSTFDQTLHKWELQSTQNWTPSQTTILGVGLMHENLSSERYAEHPTMQNIYVYGQQDWSVSNSVNLIAGFRFDNHNTYGSQFSPKISVQYKVTDWLNVRASTGRGFKAPNFSQLFLNYTNPTVGYTAVGSSDIAERIKELQQAGKIETMLRDISTLEPISAEHSWAFNTGFDLIPTQNVRFKVNFFYNRVTDLIEPAPVAVKTNGQMVFTYFNLDKVFTRGIEAQLFWRPVDHLKLSLGYQFLNAERLVEETKTVQDDQGNPVQKTFSYYKPMFNRSKHSGTFKIFYTYHPLDLETNLRGTYHGRYGFGDPNGNGYVDADEYVDGYMVWDMAVSKTFNNQYTLQAGIDNIFNFTSPKRISYLSGRLFYIQVSLNI